MHQGFSPAISSRRSSHPTAHRKRVRSNPRVFGRISGGCGRDGRGGSDAFDRRFERLDHLCRRTPKRQGQDGSHRHAPWHTATLDAGDDRWLHARTTSVGAMSARICAAPGGPRRRSRKTCRANSPCEVPEPRRRRRRGKAFLRSDGRDACMVTSPRRLTSMTKMSIRER